MLKLVTFNIRCDYDQDGANSFRFRKPVILKKLAEEKPDVICFQEVLPHVAAWLKENLTEYTVIGCGRSETLEDEQMTVAFRTKRLNLINMETFWLSPTPYVPASRYEEQSICPRVCTEVSGRDQAFNLAFFVCDRQCYRIMLLHQFPCPLHRHAVCRSRCLMKIHVFHLGSHIRQITGCRHMEIFQYKFCFFVDLSGSLCHICSLGCSILDVGICDRRTDGIRVRILVSDDINFIIFSHK